MLAHKAALWVGIVLLVLSSFDEARLEAQAPATSRPRAAASSSDAAKKAQILASDRWRRAQAEFQQWLSVQVVYTPRQVAQAKAKLAAEVQKMSAAQLQQFLDQWDAKLKILLGGDADEARAWLGQYMSAMSDGYRAKFLKKMGVTDISTLTAAQIEEEILKIRLERQSIRQQQTAFDQTRMQTVQAQHQANVASRQRQFQEQELLDATTAAPSGPYPGSVQGPYNPRPSNNDRMGFYVNPSGEIGYSLNF